MKFQSSTKELKALYCLFCNGQERNYKPEADKDFICGSCVQLFLRADSEDLKRAHAKALTKGYSNKASAIESFLENGGNQDGKQINTRRNTAKPSARKRGPGNSWSFKGEFRPAAPRKKTPIYSGKQEVPTVS
jgi:hypothetical protein